jgi:hypothetical protein
VVRGCRAPNLHRDFSEGKLIGINPGDLLACMKTGIMLFVSFLAVGCASTKMTQVHVNPDGASGPFDKLMVIGLGADEPARVEFESSVTEKLASQGVPSIPSNTQIPSQKEVTTDSVREKAQADGVDGVLVTRVIDIKKESTYRLSETDTFNQWWEKYGSYSTVPVITGETKTFVIETKLFDVATEKPVYSSISESFAPKSREQIISELVPIMVNDLSKRGMIANK